MYLEADTTPDVTNVYTATCTGAADLQWTNWQAGQAVCNHTFTALSSQYQSFHSYLVCISVIPPKEKRTSLLGRMASDHSKNLYLSYWDGNLGVLRCASWNVFMPLLWPYLFSPQFKRLWLPGSTILCKVKLCKTFQGREDGGSSCLRLIHRKDTL